MELFSTDSGNERLREALVRAQCALCPRALAINRSQGQTARSTNKILIDLRLSRRSRIGHGQAYVVVSRVHTSTSTEAP